MRYWNEPTAYKTDVYILLKLLDEKIGVARKLCRDDQVKAERLIVETGRVFEDVIAESSRTGAWCIEDRRGHREIIQLVFLHGPDAGAACRVEEFVSERGLSLAERAR